MTFEHLMSDSAEALADIMGDTEDVEIIPASGSRYSVKAIVIRGDLVTRQGNGGKVLSYEARVIIRRSVYPVVTIKADKIGLRLRLGDAANTERLVTQIITQDGGQWHLGL